MIIDGIHLDLSGLKILPGPINSHDHLEYALFPRLGSGPYPSATEWARDIYHPNESPVREQLRVPKHLRLIWGGLRNLLAGVTTVCHHNPYHPIFDREFPVRVVKRFGWAHSFAFANVAERFAAAPARAPFIIHLGEGTNAASCDEIFRLCDIGALQRRTVLVHAVGLNSEGWNRVQRSEAGVVWCPRSNLFTLGATLDIRMLLDRGIPVAIATDSPLTAAGDLLDELRFAIDSSGISPEQALNLVTGSPARVLGLHARPADFIAVRKFGEPPDLVAIGGQIRLISSELADGLPAFKSSKWSSLQLNGRPAVLVPFPLSSIIEETRSALGSNAIFLGGREVIA
jgi:cytosine/adenosine deaminase-related metal-dependent hydrolase